VSAYRRIFVKTRPDEVGSARFCGGSGVSPMLESIASKQRLIQHRLFFDHRLMYQFMTQVFLKHGWKL
jgi:hypothetical protein